nr:MAG TPA: hypothetical protein [Caudoviricetes sp.]
MGSIGGIFLAGSDLFEAVNHSIELLDGFIEVIVEAKGKLSDICHGIRSPPCKKTRAVGRPTALCSIPRYRGFEPLLLLGIRPNPCP